MNTPARFVASAVFALNVLAVACTSAAPPPSSAPTSPPAAAAPAATLAAAGAAPAATLVAAGSAQAAPVATLVAAGGGQAAPAATLVAAGAAQAAPAATLAAAGAAPAATLAAAGAAQAAPAATLVASAGGQVAPAATLAAVAGAGQARPVGQAAAAGTLTVAISVLPDAFDTSLALASIPSLFFWPGFDALTWVDGAGHLQPGLAKSWSSPDGTTWTFNLRDDVTFQDGTPFQAQDVVGTFQFYENPANKARNSSALSSAVVEAPNATTVTLTLPKPQPDFPTAVAAALVVKGRSLDQNDPKSLVNYLSTTPIGTGPYKVVKFTAKQSLEYQAMPAGFVSPRGPAVIQSLVFRDLPDGSSRLAALRAGDIQLDYDVPFDSLDSLKAGGFAVGTFAGTNKVDLNLDVNAGPTQDVRVRQALNYAVDKASIIAALRGGVGAPDGQLLGSSVVGYNPAVQAYPYDVAKAKQLLADAGFANGLDLGTLSFLPVVFNQDLSAAVQADLAKAGVTVKLQQVEQANWLSAFSGGPTARPGLWAYAYNWENTWEADSVYRWWSSDIPAANGRRWTDQQFDDLYQKAKASLDPQVRAQTYQQAAQYFHDQAPVLFLWDNAIPLAYDGKRIQWNPGLVPDMFTTQLKILS